MPLPLSNKKLEFIDRAISLQNPEKDVFHEVGYWARVWVQGALPHSNPGNVPVWGRENGAFSLTVQPGMDIVDGKAVNYGIPYGSIPRLIMCWMCTEAVRTKEPKLFLGDSLAKFMQEVGIGKATGGRWGSITRLKDQMLRLTQARISYRYRGEEAFARRGIQIAKEDMLWWSESQREQRSLFQSYIVLDDAFFNEIVTKPVPIKLEALKLLKQSSLALDLYTWLTFRVYGLEEPVVIAWSTLEKQLGANYKQTKEFARKCKETIEKVRVLYPQLKVQYLDGRLKLMPSASHVGRRKRSILT